jgi:hypothetical protein
VYHPDWLANLVLVPKRIKIEGCVLIILTSTKSTKKDIIGLPWINQVMDSMAGCSLLSFLDCYSGYHQIPIKVENQIKTSFITSFSPFCYTTMLFRLKSTGAMYQRGIQKSLHSQLGCNAEAYIDDMVVRTRKEGLISDLAKTFDNLREFKIKLNTEKCTLGMPSRKLLDYLVSWWGIDPNPEKVSAITKIAPPESLHDVQKLTGCLAFMSRFISWLGIRGFPFFKLLKK